MKKARPVKKRRPRLTPQDFLAAGLGKLPDAVVARKMDRSPQSVYFMRKKLGIPYDAAVMRKMLKSLHARKAMRRFLPRRGYDWSSVDWSQTNVAIARAHGFPVQTVTTKRHQLRREGHPIPRSPYPFLVKPSGARKASRSAPRRVRSRPLRSSR